MRCFAMVCALLAACGPGASAVNDAGRDASTSTDGGARDAVTSDSVTPDAIVDAAPSEDVVAMSDAAPDVDPAPDAAPSEDAPAPLDAPPAEDAPVAPDAPAPDAPPLDVPVLDARDAAPPDATAPMDAATPADTRPDSPVDSPADSAADSPLDARPEAGAGPVVLPLVAPLTGADVGVLINTDDPQSVAVGEHYARTRNVPAANVVRLALGARLGRTMTAAVFTDWKTRIDAALPAAAQVLAVTWTQPSVVENCMSITSALAFGYDARFCRNPAMSGCQPSATSMLYDHATTRPFADLRIRPAVMLAATSAMRATALIDRGLAADGTMPEGQGFFVRTNDVARSVRYGDFMLARTAYNRPEALALEYIDNSMNTGSNWVEGRTGVLFYLTGDERIQRLTTNTYRPGALGDHLTSFGGSVSTTANCADTAGGQMSAMCFLEAGLTGSYGTVIEPCNYQDKFPRASVLVRRYFRGEPLVLAYWKSVRMPGEGIFLGEPLARPFGTTSSFDGANLTIRTTEFVPGRMYAVESASSSAGPWSEVRAGLTVPRDQRLDIVLTGASAGFYRLVQR